jgi:hypothetical protein
MDTRAVAVTRTAYVHEAELRLDDGTDPAVPGAAVTTGLCGHWEHHGPCRWPHNNDIRIGSESAVFRTLFVASPADEPGVRERIDRILRTAPGWSVLRIGPRSVAPDEERLAQNLARTPLP